MNISPPLTPKAKAGTCPHGLPLGACPICNGMGGGGGGGSSKKATKPEMSWSECYVMWQQMQKAKQNPQQNRNEAIQAQMISQFKLQVNLGNMAQKVANLAEKLTAFTQRPQSSSTVTSKLLNFSASLAIAGLNILKNVMTTAQKVINFVQEKLADISDKLNAVFGELKNAIEKKISDRLKDFKKKIKSLFGIYDSQDIDDEDKKIEEEKRIFEFKTFTHKFTNILKEKFTQKKEAKELEYGISS